MREAVPVARWADIIAVAYAADARPPLPEHLRDKLTSDLADALAKAVAASVPSARWADYVNPVLDEWERSLGVSGLRLHRVDAAEGTAVMAPRSEADHPLRPFGGQ